MTVTDISRIAIGSIAILTDRWIFRKGKRATMAGSSLRGDVARPHNVRAHPRSVARRRGVSIAKGCFQPLCIVSVLMAGLRLGSLNQVHPTPSTLKRHFRNYPPIGYIADLLDSTRTTLNGHRWRARKCLSRVRRAAAHCQANCVRLPTVHGASSL